MRKRCDQPKHLTLALLLLSTWLTHCDASNEQALPSIEDDTEDLGPLPASMVVLSGDADRGFADGLGSGARFFE